jgi:hypothetical protein
VPSEGDGAEPATAQEQTTEHVGEATFSYDRLISKSTNPIRGIDYKRREVCYQETGKTCCFVGFVHLLWLGQAFC